MDPTTVALAIAGAFNLVLAALLVLRGPKTATVRAYAAAVLATVLWIAAITVLRLATAPRVQFLALATSYLAATAIAATFWSFVAFFSGRPAGAIPRLLVFGGGLAVAALAFFSPAFVQGIAREPDRALRLALGPAHLLFAGYFVAVMAAAFARLWRQYRGSAGAARAQLAAVFLGTFLSVLAGSTFNLVLVQAGNARYIGWGPVATMIMVAFIGYAIIRHHLMQIRVIAAELFTLLLLVALTLAIVPSPDRPFRAIDGLAAVLTLSVGILLIRSVRQEVQAREALAAANDQLRRLDAAKSEFISLAGHQLRTPVTVIREYTSRVLGQTLGPISSPAAHTLEQVLAAAKQLVRLVDELLNLSRIEAGHLSYDFKPVRLEEIVEGVLAEVAGPASRKSLTLRFQNDNRGGLRVRADREKLHEVALNLVDNAIAYTSAGEIEIALRPTTYAGQPMLRLSVTDHGIGISAEDLPRLFEKFSRTEEARRTRPDGLGLGLYLVRKVVEDHRGRAWAESEGPGKGSTFFVELPVAGTN